jgi:predicted DNA-binding transcriptional regulator AlpA
MKIETQGGLYEDGYLRLHQIIGDRTAMPVILPIIPVSKATIYNWVKAGRFPNPTKLGPGTSAWRIADVRAWLKTASGPVEKEKIDRATARRAKIN